MKKTDAPPPKMQDGFFLTIDGKQYGPFKEEARKQYADLNHSKGVSFAPVRLRSGWIEPIKPPKRMKADKSTPLLADIGFVPKPKIGRQY